MAGPARRSRCFYTILSTTGRVVSGLAIASTLAVSLGVAIRYFRLFGKLTLPTITLLAPVSPIAWLPVAIFLFGIGNGPAIFMVVIALLFHMVLATINQIDSVKPQPDQCGPHDGRFEAADLRARHHPGHLAAIVRRAAVQPVRRLDGRADRGRRQASATALGRSSCWPRNTFNPSLVFFTIGLIGVLGYLFDLCMRLAQRKLLYWVPQGTEVLRGL